MMIDTAMGMLPLAALTKVTTHCDVPCGQLTTEEYFLDGELVKCEQRVDVAPEHMPPALGAGRL